MEEAVPDADDTLTLAELRWCVFEPVRLEGDSAETAAVAHWEVDGHNARLRAYRERCSKKTYRVKDKTAVESELTPEKRKALRDDGIARVRQARAERERRRVHVRVEAATVRASPESTGEELGRIRRWGDLIRTGRTQGPWYEVEWRVPQSGWVLEGLVQAGSGEKARFDFCERHAGRRAGHNEIVRGRIEPGRVGSIRVLNDTGMDAYVKLVNREGKVALAFLVGEGRTAALKGIPLGSYDIAFATGSKFSRGCDSFSKRGNAGKFADRIDYDADSGGWTLSLHRVRGGSARTNAMSYEDFDGL
ncbi:MAG: hypothetical protein OYH76_21755 [Defluviicoccus sp.]|nr:hypothetical protein [Defluviicoccus sp.]